MKPAPFDLIRPESVDEALAALAEEPSVSKLLAGGQSLMAMLNMRLLTPEVLIDIGGLRELEGIRMDGEQVHIGAGTTQIDLEFWPGLDSTLPLVALALAHLGHRQTRNRGTVGGSLAHADPSAELPLCLALLDGQVSCRSARGERLVSAEAFQTGMLETCLAPDEMVVEISLPLARPGERVAFEEFSPRQGDFAIVSVAALRCDTAIRIAVGGARDVPHVRTLESDLDEAALTDWLNELAWSLPLQADAHASTAFRRKLVRVLGQKVLLAVMGDEVRT